MENEQMICPKAQSGECKENKGLPQCVPHKQRKACSKFWCFIDNKRIELKCVPVEVKK